MFRVIIAGGRDYNDYDTLKNKCDYYLGNVAKTKHIEIVSGVAKSADSLGVKYAEEKKYYLKLYPADWKSHGKSAGYVRNTSMAEYADALIAFWDGKSKGTQHMIETAKTHKLIVKVVRY